MESKRIKGDGKTKTRGGTGYSGNRSSTNLTTRLRKTRGLKKGNVSPTESGGDWNEEPCKAASQRNRKVQG